jgi:hypothetical protein
MALKLRRAEKRFIPQSTRAVSLKRVLGSAPAELWPCIFNRDLEATETTVALATRKDPCRPRTLPPDSAGPSVNRCHGRVLSVPRNSIGELLLAAAGRELKRGLETLRNLNRGVSGTELCPELEGADLAKSEAVAAAGKDCH